MIGICLRCLAIFLSVSPSLLTSIAFASRGRGLGKSILDIIVDGITDNRKLKISKISMQIIFQRVGRSSKFKVNCISFRQRKSIISIELYQEDFGNDYVLVVCLDKY